MYEGKSMNNNLFSIKMHQQDKERFLEADLRKMNFLDSYHQISRKFFGV